MKITRYLALALAAGLLVCTATACSSSDDDALTKSEWVKQANAICVAGSKKTEALSKKLQASGSNPSTKQMNDYIKAATANSVAQIGEIKDLGYPADDKAELEPALVTWENTLTEMGKNPDKAQELSADKKVTAATTTLRKYGLDKCAGSGS